MIDLQIGTKIKSLRLASDLTQEELANRARLTKGFISQLENEQSSISVDSLSDILDALGISIPEFFTESKETQVVFNPKERIAVEGTGAGTFELLVPGSTNHEMDPILVNLKPGEKLQEKEPHPGEQFGYVLKGTLKLLINDKQYTVPSKNCFYFKSDTKHQFVNSNGKEVTFLWITTPPQM